MKKYLIACLATTVILSLNAQTTNKLKNKLPPQMLTAELSEDEIARGLKEALNNGVDKGVGQLSLTDGYFKDLSIKILMPDDAKKVESKLRKMGQDRKVDEAIESFNRAAEEAAVEAKAIFKQAILNMTLSEAKNILKGEDDAATEFLKSSTRQELFAKFKPVIAAALQKVGATKHWETIISTYNRIPMVERVDPDLETYVTNKAIDGLFVQIAKEEKNIRDNPGARTSELLKKVFK